MKYVFLAILIVLFALLVVKAVSAFKATNGNFLDKLAGAWNGSLTIFVLAWGGILSLLLNALDFLSSLTGDPSFASFADSLNQVIPAQYHPLIPIAVIGVGIAARATHNSPVAVPTAPVTAK